MSEAIQIGLFVLVGTILNNVLTYIQNRRLQPKTDAETENVRSQTVAAQNKTIMEMVARMSAQDGIIFGLRDTVSIQNEKILRQDGQIAGLTGALETSNKGSKDWQVLAEQRLKDLDGLPQQLADQKTEIQRLQGVAAVNADARQTEANTASTVAETAKTAANTAAAAQAGTNTELPQRRAPPVIAPDKPTL